MGRLVWVRLFALGAVALVGCQNVVRTMDVQLVVAGEEKPLEGAEICETGTANCETTDGNGIATLALRANRELSHTVEKEGYGSLLYPVVTGMVATSAELDSNMNTDEWLTENLANLQSSYPFVDTGMILVVIIPRFAGATLRLLNATGSEVSYYKDEEGNWRSDLQATTSGGTGRASGFATGGFVEVGAGVVQVEIGGTAQGCALDSRSGGTLRGWPGDAPNTIRVPVQNGFETRAVVNCQSPP